MSSLSLTGMNGLTPQELEIFRRDGYLVRRGLTDAATCDAIAEMARTHLEVNLAPIEYEVDVQYPGAPKSKDAPGGDTCRRLLHAYPVPMLFVTGRSAKALNNHCRRC